MIDDNLIGCFSQVIDLSIPMGDFHEWFAGAKMNYAENILKYRDNHIALIAAGKYEID